MSAADVSWLLLVVLISVKGKSVGNASNEARSSTSIVAKLDCILVKLISGSREGGGPPVSHDQIQGRMGWYNMLNRTSFDTY